MNRRSRPTFPKPSRRRAASNPASANPARARWDAVLRRMKLPTQRWR